MELDTTLVETLALAARNAREQAYAPYSRFQVGAALLCEDGSIITGCNVENASYSLTCCAERNAVFAAVAQGKTRFTAVAVAVDGRVVPPCGACRQVLAEFNTAMTIILCGENEPPRMLSLAQLLPEPFTPDFLLKTND